MKFNALSLFASAGIAETYLHKHGVHVRVAAELLPERVRFYQHMYPDTVAIQGDLTETSVYESVLSLFKSEQPIKLLSISKKARISVIDLIFIVIFLSFVI